MSQDQHPPEAALPDQNWVAFVGPFLGLADPVFCRIAEIEGRVRIIDLHLSGGGLPVTGATLRQLPIAAMERVAGTALRATETETSGPTLQLTSSLEGLKRLLKDPPPTKSSGEKIPGPPPVLLYGWNDGEPCIVMQHDPPIDWSKGQPITDLFLRDVGEAYDAAIQRGEAPAKSIAESTGASQKTVQSWIYQGRRKGVIAPAQGKGRIK